MWRKFPYGVEYAKTNRSICNKCKMKICEESLKMSVRLPAHRFDGMLDNWYHFACFWETKHKNPIDEASIKGMEVLKWDDQEAIREQIIKMDEISIEEKDIEFKVEISKSSAAKCFKCKEKLKMNVLRIAYKNSNYHLACFKDLELTKKPALEITEYENLKPEEKASLENIFPAIDSSGIIRDIKRKEEDCLDSADSKSIKTKRLNLVIDESTKPKMKEQTDLLFNLKMRLNAFYKDIGEFISNNNIPILEYDNLFTHREIIADILAFGVPADCPLCSNGPLRYSIAAKGYICTGRISEFTRCTYFNKNPERRPMKINYESKSPRFHSFLKEFQKPPLSEHIYAQSSETSSSISSSTEAPKNKQHPSSSKNDETEVDKSNVRVVIKNGCMVDAKCNVADVTHVYIDPDTKKPWQVTLGQSDVQTGRNSFYKLQLLEHDLYKIYYVFRSWGRIGTGNGGEKTKEFNNLLNAQRLFKDQFYLKSRNKWEDIDNFKKDPLGMNIIEVEFDGTDNNDEALKKIKINLETSTSKLPYRIKSLLNLIFDIELMNITMTELEVNMEEMPLGKLSRKHLLNAYQVLTDIQTIIQSDCDPVTLRVRCMDASNRFYTLIPHSTGMQVPPILDNLELIKKKTEMIDNLLEIHDAYKIIKSESNINKDEDIADTCYKKLNCEMEVVERGSEEYNLIEKYMKNTNFNTSFNLKIIDILKLNREEDRERFKEEIGNRHLLWHGSRTFNYVGILSQGLRIAPPEAPMTGYMFGKGIYTTDMVSKSATYCCAPGEGLLLLCDVALGNMHELKKACNMSLKNLPPGTKSVKGIGKYTPNPDETETFDNLKVPCGKIVETNAKGLYLIHNEYIVYDPAQLRLRYLIRTSFVD